MLALTGGLIFGGTQAWAVKAKPGVIDYVQPNGSIMQILVHGDEFFNYATTTDGTLLQLNPNGTLTISPETLSEMKQRPSRKSRQAVTTRGVATGEPKYRYSSSAFPTVGTPHSLVILVEYPDYGFSVSDPKEYFEDFLNGEEFTRDNGTGSCRKFYIENSSGAFAPTFDVYGPVMMKNKRVYYGGGDEANACQMVVEAVKAIDKDVDFSVYDHNGDGYVDSVYIIYAHKGEADSYIDETVWPYSYELEDENVYLSADGVKFNTYGCSNELASGRPSQGTKDRIDGIGTFTHEFGHVLGLPDLYNTNSSSDNTTPCDWSVMDSGSYNNDARTPCNLSSFERYSLGWLTPSEIVASGDYTLGQLGATNEAYIMTTEENKDEFFIIEYRNNEGWDKYLPSEGMLVWHIDFLQRYWDANTPNNTRNHQRVRLVRADNETSLSASGLKGDPFPGGKNVTVFGSNTTPALSSWNGNDLNVTRLSDIRQEDGMTKFSAAVTEFRGDSKVEGTVSEARWVISGCLLHVSEGEVTVFDISGRKVAAATPGSPVGLEKGLYIIEGKKVLL